MRLAFTFILFFFILSIHAQCIRSGSFIANDPNTYPISGDGSIQKDESGQMVAKFAQNFATVQGLRLEVYLARTPDLNINTDVKISTTPLGQGTSLGGPISGEHIFEIPESVDIGDYDQLLIQCTSINELWGNIELGAIEGNCDNTTALSISSKFTAKSNQTNITLDWTSLSEVYNAGFDIERSTDGTAFTQLSFVEANKTNGNRRNEYVYIDRDVDQNVTYYYRLKQVDVDGKFEYSSIVNATIIGSEVILYPIPAHNYINVAGYVEGMSIDVYSTIGKRVITDIRSSHIDISNLSVGTYIISIEQDNLKQVKRFVKR